MTSPKMAGAVGGPTITLAATSSPTARTSFYPRQLRRTSPAEPTLQRYPTLEPCPDYQMLP